MATVYSSAMENYKKGNYRQALSAFRNSLELGNERSAYGLALCMHFGRGMFVDKSSAKQLIDGYLDRIRGMAEGGDGEACQVMGLYYYEGVFAERNLPLAESWFARGAEAGDSDCKVYLKELKDRR